MPWRCGECTRFWGCGDWARKACPLCRLRQAERIILSRIIADLVVRKRILQFIGSEDTVRPLPQLCFLGTARNCRCHFCRLPAASFDDSILQRLARKTGRGRAVAARWVHICSHAQRHGGAAWRPQDLERDARRGPVWTRTARQSFTI